MQNIGMRPIDPGRSIGARNIKASEHAEGTPNHDISQQHVVAWVARRCDLPRHLARLVATEAGLGRAGAL